MVARKLTEKQALDMLRRLVANFPALQSPDDTSSVNGADLTEWLANELWDRKLES
jgi:hypothetical protein